MCGCILGWRSVTYHNLVTVTLNLTSDLVSRNWCISPIFFEIGIPNLVCKCILGCLSVTNHFWVTVTLTSDLVFKNYCVQSISPILFDVGIPNLGWWFLLGWRSGAYNFESFWPWHWLLASFLGFSCYIIAIFPQMCLVLDQFLWGHSSRVCDISCFQLRNRSAPAVNCWVIIHCLEVSCKEDKITSARRAWFIFAQLIYFDSNTQQTTKIHSKSSAPSNFPPLLWRSPANT